MNLTVPMQAGGVKSLPAELKGWGRPIAGPGGPYFGGGPTYRWPPPPRPGSSPGFTPGSPPIQVRPPMFGGGPVYLPGPGGPGAINLAGLGYLGYCDDAGNCFPDPTPDPIVVGDAGTIPGIVPYTGGIDVAGYDPTALLSDISKYSPGGMLDAASVQALAAQVPASSGYSGPKVLPVGAQAPAAPNGYQWAQLINAAGNNMVQVLAATRPGTSYTQLPNGTKIVYSQNPGYAVQPGVGAGLTIGSGGLTAGLSGNTMLLVAAVALMFVLGRK